MSKETHYIPLENGLDLHSWRDVRKVAVGDLLRARRVDSCAMTWSNVVYVFFSFFLVLF